MTDSTFATNYYWSVSDPSRPFVKSSEGNAKAQPPSNATRTPIPSNIPTGSWACWNKEMGKWDVVKDSRGKTLYSKATGKSEISTYIGIPDTLTELKPSTPYDYWDYENNHWVTNAEEQRRQLIEERKEYRDEQVEVANYQIIKASDCISYLTGQNKNPGKYIAHLNNWNNYRIKLSTIIIDGDTITWPEEPDAIDDNEIKGNFPTDPNITKQKELETLQSRLIYLNCKVTTGTITPTEQLELTQASTQYVTIVDGMTK